MSNKLLNVTHECSKLDDKECLKTQYLYEPYEIAFTVRIIINLQKKTFIGFSFLKYGCIADRYYKHKIHYYKKNHDVLHRKPNTKLFKNRECIFNG